MSSCSKPSSTGKSDTKNRTQSKTEHHVKSLDPQKYDKQQVLLLIKLMFNPNLTSLLFYIHVINYFLKFLIRYMTESILNQVVRVCLCYLSFCNQNIYFVLQKLFRAYFFIFLLHQNFMHSAMPKNSEKILT